MQDCKLIAVDLAKNVFQVCVINSSNEIESNKPYKRKQFIEKIAQYKPTTIVMEACIQQIILVDCLKVTVIR